jgi:DNA modification methylase
MYVDTAADPEAHIAWLTPWLEASRAALTATGSLFVHLEWRAVHYAKVFLDRMFGRATFAGEIVWCYSIGGKSRRGFGRKHDTILWYGKTPGWAFYPEQVKVARRGGSHMRVVVDAEGRRVQEKTDRRTGKVYRYPIDDGKVPEDWWPDIETLNHSDGERCGWPSQKPERLLRRILLAVTQEGDAVADWFGGSGTTAVVAQQLKRRFVVADASMEAIEITALRLERQGAIMAAAGDPPPPVLIESGVEDNSSVARFVVSGLASGAPVGPAGIVRVFDEF